MPWRNIQTKISHQTFYMYTVNELMNCQDLRSCGSISLKTLLIVPENFLTFRCNTEEIINGQLDIKLGYFMEDELDTCCFH